MSSLCPHAHLQHIGGLIVELMATQHHPPAFYDVLNDVHRPFLSDERVWYGAIHNPKSVRPSTTLARGAARTGRQPFVARYVDGGGQIVSFSGRPQQLHAPRLSTGFGTVLQSLTSSIRLSKSRWTSCTSGARACRGWAPYAAQRYFRPHKTI